MFSVSPDRPIVIDGGLATDLEDHGHDLSGDLWSARLLAEAPEAIRAAHERYFAAGADIGISASYQASRSGFVRHGYRPHEADRLLRLSVELVRQAGEAVPTARPRYVAASVGPYGATLHDGSEYRGNYGVGHAELVDFHAERLAVLLSAGPDLLAIETVPDVVEAVAIVAALEATDSDIPAWLSFSCSDARSTNAGQPIEQAAALVAQTRHVDAIGINCTAPEHISGLINRIRAAEPALPIVVYPNAGRTWDAAVERWRGEGAAVIPDAAVSEWLAAGAGAVGGCCGLGPDAIRGIAEH